MKSFRLLGIYTVAATLTLWWLAMIISNTRETNANYYWQAGLSVMTLGVAAIGLMVSRHWDGLKSGVGKGIFFIAAGALMWGLGQTGWSYFTITQPATEIPDAPILDFLYFSSIPLWIYGIFQLSRATGAKYGLKKAEGKIYAFSVLLIISAVSYYFLVEVARGGFGAYFDTSAIEQGSLPFWWVAFTDLGYAFGDAVALVLSIAIFGLSWQYLGGRFKKPIVLILLAFGLLYVGDFFFSYFQGVGEYYNGHWTDLLYLAVMSLLGAAFVLIDPSKQVKKPTAQTAPASNTPPAAPATEPTPTPQPVPANQGSQMSANFQATDVPDVPAPQPSTGDNHAA